MILEDFNSGLTYNRSQKGFFMANRIESHSPRRVPVEEPVEPDSVPPAPSRVSSGGTAAPAPLEKGYIERLVIRIKDFVIFLFQRIAHFIKGVDGSAASSELQDPDLAILQTAVLEDFRLLKSFSRLSPEFQEYIYTQIGKNSAQNGNPIEEGKKMVKMDAKVLKTYIKI